MGRPNKKQHKVPRCYLEAFTDESGTLWEADQRYNLRPNKPERILTERDYYTVRLPDGKGGTLFIEKEVLGNIEAAYADVYKRVIKPRKPIEVQDRAVLSIFIASMMERVSPRREAMQDFFAQLKKFEDFGKDLTAEEKARISTYGGPIDKGNAVPLSDMLKAGEDIGSLHSSMIPDTVAVTAPIIFDMKWGLMTTEESSPFITSDCPAVMVNPNLPDKSIYQAGLIQKKVELTIPLSPTVAVLCGWDIAYEGVYLPVNERVVHSTNKRTMRYARTLVSSNKDFLAEYVRLEKEARGVK